MANLGRPIATDPEKPFAFDPDAMAAALDALDAVLASLSAGDARLERDQP